ncbi:MAG: ADP-ribosylglycohydrolase family protein [Candidatus Eisenbacteria bacterium]
MNRSDRYRGCLLGLAAGDALGAPVEGAPRGSFAPLTDMVGEGPDGLPRGTWTDDTSLALCLGESLVEPGGFDPADQMRRYLRWLDDGYMSCASAGFVALYYFRNRELIQEYSAESSRTTHGAEECLDACRLMGAVHTTEG